MSLEKEESTASLRMVQNQTLSISEPHNGLYTLSGVIDNMTVYNQRIGEFKTAMESFILNKRIDINNQHWGCEVMFFGGTNVVIKLLYMVWDKDICTQAQVDEYKLNIGTSM